MSEKKKYPSSIRRLKNWIRQFPEQIDWVSARAELERKQKRHNMKVLRECQLDLFEVQNSN